MTPLRADHRSQFYLYRVHPDPTTAVREGWVVDPSDFVGDVMLHEVCAPGSGAARYLNYHEDPGGLSLALGRDVIASVQRIPMPAPDAYDGSWVHDAVVALCAAGAGAGPPVGVLSQLRRFQLSPQALASQDLVQGLAARLPINLQWQFTSASAFVDGADPTRWARRATGLISAIENPAYVLDLLDGQECRRL